MTNTHSTQPANPSTVNGPASEPPFLSLHTAVVLLAALIVGVTIGVLTVFTDVPVAAAVIAGLTATGASVPVLRSLIR
jgi:ABC-type antimicrobial peptide transport system permease subunit